MLSTKNSLVQAPIVVVEEEEEEDILTMTTNDSLDSIQSADLKSMIAKLNERICKLLQILDAQKELYNPRSRLIGRIDAIYIKLCTLRLLVLAGNVNCFMGYWMSNIEFCDIQECFLRGRRNKTSLHNKREAFTTYRDMITCIKLLTANLDDDSDDNK